MISDTYQAIFCLVLDELTILGMITSIHTKRAKNLTQNLKLIAPNALFGNDTATIFSLLLMKGTFFPKTALWAINDVGVFATMRVNCLLLINTEMTRKAQIWFLKFGKYIDNGSFRCDQLYIPNYKLKPFSVSWTSRVPKHIKWFSFPLQASTQIQ